MTTREPSPCPTCGVGRLVLREIKAGRFAGRRFVTCSTGRKDDPSSCDFFTWVPERTDA